MARLVRLPSGRVFREEMEKPDIYRRPKDMFGMSALGQAIDFADKVVKSEGVGALANIGEQIYDKYAEGDTTGAVKAQADAGNLLKQAAQARVGLELPQVPPVGGATGLKAAVEKAMGTAKDTTRERMLAAMRGAPVAGVPMEAVPEAYKLSEEARRQAMAPLAVKEDDAEAAARDARLKQLGAEIDAGKVQGTTEVAKDQGEFVGPQKELLNKVYGIVEGQKPTGVPAGGPAAPATPQVPPPTQAPPPQAPPVQPPVQAPVPAGPPATGGSVAAPAVQMGQQAPQVPAGPASRPPAPDKAKGMAEPVPAGQPGETPVAPVGEGTPKSAEEVKKEDVKQNLYQTIDQGLNAIQNEYSRNAERAAATIDFGAAMLSKSKDAMTDAEILARLMKAVKDVEPPQPSQAPLNIPNKLTIQQLSGFARQANTTDQQQQVLDAFSNKMVTGMYAANLASRLSGEYKKPWLDAVISQFPARSTPARMHPADAMYKMAAAVKAYQSGEKTEAEIAAGTPEAKAFAARAGGIKKMALAQQAAEKATEIRELLQARKIEYLSKAQNAIDDFNKAKKGGGAGGKQETIDAKFWYQTNGVPLEEASRANRNDITQTKRKIAELDGEIARARASSSSTTPVPVNSPAYRAREEAKAKLEGFLVQRQAAVEALGELETTQKDLDEKVTQMRETAGMNIGKKQKTLVTAEEGAGRYTSPQMKAEEAAKQTAAAKTGTGAASKTKTDKTTGKPTGGQPARTEAAAKLKKDEEERKKKAEEKKKEKRKIEGL